MTQLSNKKVIFKILESHSNHTSNEVEEKNSHLQTILQLTQFYLKSRHIRQRR